MVLVWIQIRCTVSKGTAIERKIMAKTEDNAAKFTEVECGMN